MIAPTQPQRRRWPKVIACLFAVVLAAVFVMRSRGVSRYDRLVEALRASGRPTTVAELRTLAPPTDAVAQAHLVAWLGRVESSAIAGDDVLVEGPEVQAWLSGERAVPPAAITGMLARHAEAIGEGRDLLASAVHLDLFSGRDTQPIDWDHRFLLPGQGMQPAVYRMSVVSGIWPIRIYAEWLRAAALASDDPSSALADLDHLASASSHPLDLTPAMIALSLSRFRDRAYLESACRNRLSAGDRERWLSEPAEFHALVADGWRGAYVLDIMPLAEHVRAHPYDLDCLDIGEPRYHGIDTALAGSMTLMAGMDDCAAILGSMVEFEERLRGTRTDVGYRDPERSRFLSAVYRASINLFEVGESMMESETEHRIARLAVRCLAWARTPGALPTDAVGFETAIGIPGALAGGRDRLALCYERVDEHRFRIYADPSAPAPNLVDAERIVRYSRHRQPPLATSPDDAAISRPVLGISNLGVEIGVGMR